MQALEYSLSSSSTPARGPSLAAQRKAATRQDIASAAARLFAENGTAGTTAAEIAHEAGISLRTFYRYFPTKEDAVTPLLAIGADGWLGLLAGAEPGEPLEVIARVAADSLTPESDADRAALRVTHDVIGLALRTPSLYATWLRVNASTAARLALILDERSTPGERAGAPQPTFHLRVLAGAATQTLQASLETWALSPTDPDGTLGTPAALVREGFDMLSRGFA